MIKKYRITIELETTENLGDTVNETLLDYILSEHFIGAVTKQEIKPIKKRNPKK
jgi:hypothetical protein